MLKYFNIYKEKNTIHLKDNIDNDMSREREDIEIKID